jgi:2-methylcitrate dehydratase PrpD
MKPKKGPLSERKMSRMITPSASLSSRRRWLIQSGGLVLAWSAGIRSLAATLDAAAQGTTAADLPISDVTTTLSTYLSRARERPLPSDVIERATWHVLDTFAAIVSGSELSPGRAALKFAREYGGKPVATVACDTFLVGPIEAALVNGTMAHADETDDTLAPGPWHPGSNVVPAALATGEQFGVSGAQFLRAVVLGYDIGTRVMAAIQPGMANSHKLTYGIGGVFGSGAAAACVAGLDARQMRWVLSYCAQQSSGIESFPRDLEHIEKGFIFAGMPARSGVTAALLVHAGWNGVNDIMAGPDNFILANAPTGKADALVDKLGERYELMRANIKKWTVGQPIHAPLDALEMLLKKQPIDTARIREIVLRYQPGSITDNSGASDINVQHAVAVMLTDKTLTFKSIHDAARLHDPAIVRLRDKIRLDPGTQTPRPPLFRITMDDGTVIVQDGTGPVLGTAQNPMTRDQLIAKCRDLMTPVLGAPQTTRLIEKTLALDAVRNVRELRPLLQHAANRGPERLSEYPFAK